MTLEQAEKKKAKLAALAYKAVMAREKFEAAFNKARDNSKTWYEMCDKTGTFPYSNSSDWMC
jgi:type I restriction-modification system DNA methylase subunit